MLELNSSIQNNGISLAPLLYLSKSRHLTYQLLTHNFLLYYFIALLSIDICISYFYYFNSMQGNYAQKMEAIFSTFKIFFNFIKHFGCLFISSQSVWTQLVIVESNPSLQSFTFLLLLGHNFCLNQSSQLCDKMISKTDQQVYASIQWNFFLPFRLCSLVSFASIASTAESFTNSKLASFLLYQPMLLRPPKMLQESYIKFKFFAGQIIKQYISVLISFHLINIYSSTKMGYQKELIAATFAVLLTAGALFLIAPEAPEANLKKDLKCVARSTMIARGQSWVDKHVPYNQQGSYDGYRTDCSGFVSMCWQLARPGLTTFTMHTVAHNIEKGALAPGDAMNCDSRHIVLFAGWTDGSQSKYVAMEEANSQTGTIKSTIPYPYWNSDSCFHPIRYNQVC